MMALYPIYMYVTQPLFFLWIFSGYFNDYRIATPFLITQKFAFLGMSSMDVEMGSQLLLTLGIIKIHRFAQCKNLKEARLVLTDLVISIMMCLNNLVLDSIAVFKWFLFHRKGAAWIPSKKNFDKNVDLITVMDKLWPSTGLGITGLVFGILYSPVWAMVASPFLVSFILGIPLSYLTGKRVKTH